MTSSLDLANLLAWSAQVAILVVAAAIVSLRWHHARARLVFWQGILAATLLVPIVGPWHQPPPEAIGNVAATQAFMTGLPLGSDPPISRLAARACLWVLGAGAACRLWWIAIGLLRIRRIRERATDMNDRPAFLFGARVPDRIRWYVSDDVGGPVTFGWRHASVLLPSRLRGLTASARDTVLLHEVIHVERRDWLFLVLEECVRAAMWFHPAVWFALSEIQLAREESVDDEVVRRTSDRGGYVEALLAVAAESLEPDVAPAPLFLRRRHLVARVSSIMKESAMSPSRRVCRFVASGSAALAAAALAVSLFPLHSEAQSLADDPGITVEPGGALLHRAPLHYPRGTAVGGQVVIEAAVDSKGHVSDARVVSGPDDLRRDALASVLQWHYVGDAAARSVQISIAFQPKRNEGAASQDPAAAGPGPRPPRRADRWRGVVRSIAFSGLSEELSRRVQDRLFVHVGDTVTNETMLGLGAAIRGIDEHLIFGVYATRLPLGSRSADSPSDVDIRIALSGFADAGAPPPPPPPPARPDPGFFTAPPPPPPAPPAPPAPSAPTATSAPSATGTPPPPPPAPLPDGVGR